MQEEAKKVIPNKVNFQWDTEFQLCAIYLYAEFQLGRGFSGALVIKLQIYRVLIEPDSVCLKFC